MLIVISWEKLSNRAAPAATYLPAAAIDPRLTPTLSRALTRLDVLPTPTLDHNAPRRAIVFPAAGGLTSPIIEAIRAEGSWETRYLGMSVGHLEGTSWLGGIGGNIVLAGHVESESGAPGPFAYLFRAKINDIVVLQEGAHSYYYQVRRIERAAPTDVHYVAQDGRHRLTLITCTDWDHSERTYLGRLVVVAEPLAPDRAFVTEDAPQ